jgi:hypothetical protein
MNSASLVAGSLERAAQGGDQAGVLVGDHQADTAETSCLERAQEPTPERLIL